MLVIFTGGIVFDCWYPDFVNSSLYLFTKDLMTFALGIAGVYIAAGGLFIWKNQIEYTKQHEAADNLHHSLLKLRDAIKYVRNPAIFPSESYEAEQHFKSKYPSASEEEIKKGTYPYVYELRWKKIQSVSSHLDENLLMAEVLWGRKIRTLLIPLTQKITELNIALKQNFEPKEYRTKDTMQIHDVIYDKSNWMNDQEDDFGNEINKAIEAIMDYTKEKTS